MREDYYRVCGYGFLGHTEHHAERLSKVVVDAVDDLDVIGTDMDFNGQDLVVLVCDGPRGYVAHFSVNYCPLCGKELRGNAE